LLINNTPSVKTKAKVTAQNDEETAGKKSVLQGHNMPLNGIRTTTSEMLLQEPKTGSPSVFCFGYQKSGTTTMTTLFKALGSISNVTARRDILPFWEGKPLKDEHILRSINRKFGLIQKEGRAIEHMEEIARECRRIRFYVVRRDVLT
jgi:hypothetical protein